MNSFTGRIRRVEDNLNIINERSEPKIKLSEEDRKIFKEVAKRLGQWVFKQSALGQSDDDIRAETDHNCKRIAKEIQNEINNGSLKLD